MNKSAEYASESDLSDEDFCPENEAASELSECSSDDEIEDEDDKNAGDDTKATKKIKKSRKKTTKSKATKQTAAETKRSTRQQTIETEDKKLEKDELESDDDVKARADALWADFLGDVKQPTTTEVEEKKKETNSPTRKANKKSTITTTKTSNTNGDTPNGKLDVEKDGKAEKDEVPDNPKLLTITEIMDFAGEEIKIEKVVNAESIKENKTGSSTSKASAIGLKRPAAAGSSSSSGGGGLGSILNQIGKKKKISVLEKTKLDWNSFKKDEGIEEELQTFNKGKDGYLERQDFLERTDLRQFEIERNLRQTRRKD